MNGAECNNCGDCTHNSENCPSLFPSIKGDVIESQQQEIDRLKAELKTKDEEIEEWVAILAEFTATLISERRTKK